MLAGAINGSILHREPGSAMQCPRDPLTPRTAGDCAGLAPAALFAAGFGPLRQDAEDDAAVLHAAGVAVRWRDALGLVHGWQRGRYRMRLARVAFAAVVEAVAAVAEPGNTVIIPRI